MSGNDLRICIGHRQDFLLPGDIPGDAATGIQINERKYAVKKQIARVDDVHVGKVNRGIAVRVGMRDMEHKGRVPVEMKSDGVSKCNFGQSVSCLVVREHAMTNIVVAYDRCTGVVKCDIATNVVAMHVSVDHKIDRCLRMLFHCFDHEV